jgi:tetratricopeptide (TPR) repeat protein
LSSQVFLTVVAMLRLASKDTSSRRARRLRAVVVFVGAAVVCAWAAPWASREWQFRRHLRTAQIAFDRFVADNAVGELTAAEKLKPGSAQVQYLLGVANRKAGHLDNCRPHLNKALELGWPAKEIRFQLLLLAFQAGDRRAESEIKQIILLPMADDVAQDTYEALALGYLSEYRIGAADTVIEHWLRWRPKSVRARLLRAEILGASRLNQEQLAQFEDVLAIEPDNYAAHLGMAHELLNEHKVDRALQEYRWCRQHWPGDLSAPLGIAACYTHQGKLSEAVQVFRELLREPLLRDQRGHVAGELGKLLRQTGQMEEAISLLAESVELNPYDQQVEYALALALAKVGRREEAEQHSKRSKELEKLRHALSDKELIMLNQPSDADSRYEAGLLLAKLGNPKASAAMMLASLRWDPRHTGAHAELAKYYHGIGREDLAQQHEALAAEVADTAGVAERGGGL